MKTSNLPTNGTAEEIAVRELDNRSLGQRIANIAHRPSSFNRFERDVLLTEAARRLIWADSYASHASDD